jgi:DNA-binding MarR family transcriptional regulator
MKPDMKKKELSALLYEFLEVIYLFQKREEGLFGVSWQEIYLLKGLNDTGSVSVGMIAKNLRSPLFGASRIVSRLTDIGLVKKTQARKNRRLVNVGITKAGKQLLKRVEDYQFMLITKNINVLKAEEIESMFSGLAKLRALLAIE